MTTTLATITARAECGEGKQLDAKGGTDTYPVSIVALQIEEGRPALPQFDGLLAYVVAHGVCGRGELRAATAANLHG